MPTIPEQADQLRRGAEPAPRAHPPAPAAYRREIANAPDPAAKREEIEADLRSRRSVFRTAETFGIEQIIDPRETRSYLQAFVERAYKVLPYELNPNPLLGVRP